MKEPGSNFCGNTVRSKSRSDVKVFTSLHGSCWHPPTALPLYTQVRILLITRVPKSTFNTRVVNFETTAKICQNVQRSFVASLRSWCRWRDNELFCMGGLIPPDCWCSHVRWQGMESDTLGAWVNPSLSHTRISGQAESLSGGVCLSLLAGGDVQMTVSSPGAVRVTQHTHSEPAPCNLLQRLWLVEGSALKTLGKAFMCKLGDCFGCILFLSLF